LKLTVNEALQELVLLPGLDADEVHAAFAAVVPVNSSTNVLTINIVNSSTNVMMD
jgi:hypothetical protein